jgi:hypothetical protein
MTEIICSELLAPEFGELLECGNKLGDLCEVRCNDGYVMSSGNAVRRCTEAGLWSGSAPNCSGKRKTYLLKTSKHSDFMQLVR